MVDVDEAAAAVKVVELVVVALGAPPLAQLTVPVAGQRVEEVRVFQGQQRVKVLVAQVALERVLGGQPRQRRFGAQRPVELWAAQALQFHEDDAAVVAGEAASLGLAEQRGVVPLAVLVEDVPVDGRQFGRQRQQLALVEGVQVLRQPGHAGAELDVGV